MLTRRELRAQFALQAAVLDAVALQAAVVDAVLADAAPVDAVVPVDAAPLVVVVPAVAVAPVEVVTPAPFEADAAHAATPLGAEAVASTGPVVDFDTAARLFSFTGENAIAVVPARRPAAPAFVRAESAASTHPSDAKVRRVARRWATTAFSASVMTVIGLMAVSVTVPAEALAAASDSIAVTAMVPVEKPDVIKKDEIQAFVSPAEGEVVQLDREQNYALTTFEQIARDSGINMSSNFVNDANSEIQWPFAVGVGMSYGYGMRSGRMHDGIDFTPGSGAQIQAVAPGTVRVAPGGGGYGVHVYVDHVVDGQRISSHYAHMQVGSLQVVDGQQVVAGDPIGKVGNTGRSFGAHLHFELLVNGTDSVDPMPWLQKHAGGWQG